VMRKGFDVAHKIWPRSMFKVICHCTMLPW
jgi:hypothetical protein